MPRFAARVDLNHSEICQGLVQLGFLVQDTSRLGNGFPDLVVKHPAKPEIGVRMVEIKSKGGKIRPNQVKLKADWEDSVLVVYTLDEILNFFGFL